MQNKLIQNIYFLLTKHKIYVNIYKKKGEFIEKREWLISLSQKTKINLFRLSKKTGLSYNPLLEIKKGKTKTIKTETLKKIAAGFDLPFEQIRHLENKYQDSMLENFKKTEVLFLLKKERKISKSFRLGNETFETISQKKIKDGILLSVNKKKGN